MEGQLYQPVYIRDLASLVTQWAKNLPTNAEEAGLIPWSEDFLEREMATPPVYLPGKPHGQSGLVGYSPWGRQRVAYDLVTQTTTKIRNVSIHRF